MGAHILWWNGNINETSVHPATLQVCAQVTIVIIRGALLSSTPQLCLAGSIHIWLLQSVSREDEGGCDLCGSISLQPEEIPQPTKGKTKDNFGFLVLNPIKCVNNA